MLSKINIKKVALGLIGLTLVKSLFRLILEVNIAAKFGASALTDAYIMSLAIPSFFGDFFIGGVFVLIFIPIFVEKSHNNSKEDISEFFSDIFSFATILLVVLTVVYILFMAKIISFIAPGFDSYKTLLTINLSGISAPLLIFFGYIVILTAVLNSLGYFFRPLLVSFIYPIGLLLFLNIFSKNFSVASLNIGASVAAMLQISLLWHFLIKAGIRPYLKIPNISKVLSLSNFIYLIASALSFQVCYIIIRMLTSRIDSGVSYLNYSRNLINLPIYLFAASLATVILPVFSLYNLKNPEGVSAKFNDIFKWVMIISVVAGSILFIFSKPIIKALLFRGEFGVKDYEYTAKLFSYFALFFFAFVGKEFMVRVVLSLRKVKTVFKIDIAIVFLNITLAFWLNSIFGLSGIVFSICIAYAVGFALYYINLKRYFKNAKA